MAPARTSVSPDLVDELARRAFEGRLEGPLILVARGATPDVEAFTCDDPTRSLRGLLLPDDTEGICMVATATAHDATRTGCRRALVILQVDRAGKVAVHLRLESDGSPSGEAGAAEGGPSGLLVDTLQRLMGLATPPPDAEVAALFSLEWLAAIDAMVVHRTTAPTWAQLAVLHPAVRTHDDGPYDDLVERCELVAGGLTWELLRTLVAAGALDAPTARSDDLSGERLPFDLHRLLGGGRTGDHHDGPRCAGTRACPICAVWFDEGSFARAVLADQPDPDTALDDLARRLPPDLARRVRTTVAPFLELR